MDRRGAYLDSSVLLRSLLRQPDALPGLSQWALVGSELLEVEARRTLHRLCAIRALSEPDLALRSAELHTFLAAVDQVPISKIILNRAGGPLGGSLKTLDAIHLVTAMIWSEYNGKDIVFLTHDLQLANAARACGLTVYPDSVRHPVGL
jgi:predicted nucleic acid-binding protein